MTESQLDRCLGESVAGGSADRGGPSAVADVTAGAMAAPAAGVAARASIVAPGDEARLGSAHRASAVVSSLLVRPAVLYALLALLAFPILEMILDRGLAVQYAVDVFDGYLPTLAALRSDWLRYGPSLWDPHLTAGNPSLLQAALPFAPDFLLSFVVPLFLAYAITYVLLIWSAGYGMHLFLRDSLRLGTPACIVGAVVYTFSFWHYVHGFAVPLLPFSLWLVDRWAASSEGRWRWGVALVLTSAFQLYAGLLQLTALVAGLQLVYLVVGQGRSRRMLRLVAEWLGIWTLAAMLFAPVGVTQLIYLPASHRTIWDVVASNPTTVSAAFSQTVSLFGSALAAIRVSGLSLGSAEYSGTFFVGGIGLLLLWVGLFRRRAARGVFVLVLLAAVPVLYLLSFVALPYQAHLGFLKSFQLDRVSHLFPLALAANVGIGAEAVFSGQARKILRRPLPLVGVLALVALLGAEAVASIQNWGAFHTWGQATAGWLLSAGAIGGGAVVALLLVGVVGVRRSLVTAMPFVAVLIVVLVGERATYARAERYLHPGLSRYSDYMNVDGGFRFIASQPQGPEGIRTLTVGFPANRAIVSGVQDAGGYQSIYPLAYHDLFATLTAPHLDKDPADAKYFLSWGNRAFAFGPELDLQVADLMGIEWIWTWNTPLDDSHLSLGYHSGAIRVYRNASAFPRAFVVDHVRSYPSRESMLAAMSTADDTQLRTTGFVVEGTPTTLPIAAPNGKASATISRYTPDQVDVSVVSSTRGLLELTDTFQSGWSATVCGRSQPIIQVDGAFRGVEVPPGSCVVTFSYRPRPTYAALGLAGVTAASLLGFTIFMGARDRRRRLLHGTFVGAPAASPAAADLLTATGAAGDEL